MQSFYIPAFLTIMICIPSAQGSESRTCRDVIDDLKIIKARETLAYGFPANPCITIMARQTTQDILSLASTGACSDAEIAEHLRQAFVKALESSDKEVGTMAASFLRTSKIPINLVDVELLVGPKTIAAFNDVSNSIQLNAKTFEPIWSSVGTMQAIPDRLRPLGDMYAPILAHELTHAREFREVGRTPGFFEAEFIAYANSAIFIRERLERDANYLGLETFNGEMVKAAGLTVRVGPWWTEPLPPQMRSMKSLHEFEHIARSHMDASSDPIIREWWLQVRLLADGFKGYLADERALSGGDGLSIFEAKPAELKADALKHISELKLCTESARETDWTLLSEAIKFDVDQLPQYAPAAIEREAEFYRKEMRRIETAISH